MPLGAVHPNGTNFRRAARYDIVGRMRKLVSTGLYEEEPKWLAWCERTPPMELTNLKLQDKRVRNPYIKMVKFVLEKYPDMRFQDCYVDGNDWSVGNDTYRDDHPVMQFVTRQLRHMNNGVPRAKAFKLVEEEMYERRMKLEKEHKIHMALALDQKIEPVFSTGHAYWHQQWAKDEVTHLKAIQWQLRKWKHARMEKEGIAVPKRMTPTLAEKQRQSWLPTEKEREEAARAAVEQKFIEETTPNVFDAKFDTKAFIEDLEFSKTFGEEKKDEEAEAKAMEAMDEAVPALVKKPAIIVPVKRARRVLTKSALEGTLRGGVAANESQSDSLRDYWRKKAEREDAKKNK